MASLFDYLDWRGDLEFSEAPLNEVDSLILSQLSYIDFEGVVSSDLGETPVIFRNAIRQYFSRHKGERAYIGKIVPSEILSLAAKASKTVRFSRMRMLGYTNQIDNKKQSQFSAVTFIPDNGEAFVSYRGTDDTLVGWKENFNMSFMQPVPAQHEAVKYLENVGRVFDGKLYVGGHSKGGNLAVYAAVKCTPILKERIITVYNNDGPGFNTDFIGGVDYKSIKGKIRTLVPHSSVVGMLLEHEENYEVIKSNASGLLQHNAFSWEVLGGKFIHLDTVTNESRLIDTSLKQWLNGMTAEERERVVDSIYETLMATNAKTLTELTADRVKLVKLWGTLDSESRSVILKCISILLRQGGSLLKKSKAKGG